MAVTVRSHSNWTESGGGAVEVDKPTGAAENDVCVAFLIAYDDTGQPITPPSDWTLIERTDVNDVVQVTLATYRKVMGASEPATYTWTTSQYTAIEIVCCTGNHTSSPIDVNSENSGRGTTVTGNGVTVSGADSLLLLGHAGYNNAASSTPSGMTAVHTAMDGVNDFWRQAVNAGATGNKTHNLGATDTWCAQMIVVKPPGGNIAGTASISVTPTGAVTGSGAVAGSAAVSVSASGAATGSGAVAGSASVSVSASGAATGTGAVAAAATIAFSATGSVVSDGGVAGSSSISVSAAGTITGTGVIAGSASIAFDASGDVENDGGNIAGSTGISFSCAGELTGTGTIAGTAEIVFGASFNNGNAAGAAAAAIRNLEDRRLVHRWFAR